MTRKLVVETVLTARDDGAERAWNRATGAAEKYEHQIGRVGGGTGGGGSGLLGINAGAAALGFVAAGATAAATAMVHLGSQAEKTNIQLAGDIQVYGYAQNYNDALLLSSKYLQQIRRDAAALPGEDSDFIQSFGIAFPAMAEKGVRSMEQMVGLSNKLTAVLISKGVDPGQIGRDISLMVGGHAGADVRSFTLMKGVLGAKGGTATTEEWNKLKVEDRFKRLEAASKRFDDTINEFSKSWEAISSTSVSYVKALAREAGGPMFAAVKTSLDYLNKLYESHEKDIISIGQLGGQMTVDAMRATGKGALGFVSGFASTQGAFTEEAAAQAPTIINELATAGNSFLEVLGPVVNVVGEFGSMIGAAVMGALPGLISFGETILSIGSLLIGGIVSILASLIGAVEPGVTLLGRVFGTIWDVGADIIVIIAAKVKPGFVALGEAISDIVRGIGQAVRWITSTGGEKGGPIEKLANTFTDEAFKAREALGIGRVDASGFMQNYVSGWFKERERMEKELAEKTKQAELNAAKRKPQKPVQDFRGSKFSIEQKFAPGFDPGRVLTAIKEDVGALAQKRLSSGISPLFGNY